MLAPGVNSGGKRCFFSSSGHVIDFYAEFVAPLLGFGVTAERDAEVPFELDAFVVVGTAESLYAGPSVRQFNSILPPLSLGGQPDIWRTLAPGAYSALLNFVLGGVRWDALDALVAAYPPSYREPSPYWPLGRPSMRSLERAPGVVFINYQTPLYVPQLTASLQAVDAVSMRQPVAPRAFVVPYGCSEPVRVFTGQTVAGPMINYPPRPGSRLTPRRYVSAHTTVRTVRPVIVQGSPSETPECDASNISRPAFFARDATNIRLAGLSLGATGQVCDQEAILLDNCTDIVLDNIYCHTNLQGGIKVVKGARVWIDGAILGARVPLSFGEDGEDHTVLGGQLAGSSAYVDAGLNCRILHGTIEPTVRDADRPHQAVFEGLHGGLLATRVEGATSTDIRLPGILSASMLFARGSGFTSIVGGQLNVEGFKMGAQFDSASASIRRLREAGVGSGLDAYNLPCINLLAGSTFEVESPSSPALPGPWSVENARIERVRGRAYEHALRVVPEQPRQLGPQRLDPVPAALVQQINPSQDPLIEQIAGRMFTAGCWLRVLGGGYATLTIADRDGVGAVRSGARLNDTSEGWRYLSVTHESTSDRGLQGLDFRIEIYGRRASVEISEPQLVEGLHLPLHHPRPHLEREGEEGEAFVDYALRAVGSYPVGTRQIAEFAGRFATVSQGRIGTMWLRRPDGEQMSIRSVEVSFKGRKRRKRRKQWIKLAGKLSGDGRWTPKEYMELPANTVVKVSIEVDTEGLSSNGIRWLGQTQIVGAGQ